MKIFASSAFGISLACLSACPASAQSYELFCQTGGFSFHFDERNYNATQYVSAPGCIAGFRGGNYVSFSGYKVTVAPRHLAIEPRSNGFSWTVKMKNTFKGEDNYTIRICGSYYGKPGCANITYTVTIK
jgi:hypothetical protein